MRRVIVVGGGVIGLLTAVECVLAGAEVTIVDQADLPYARATSYDWHRIVRQGGEGRGDLLHQRVFGGG